MNPDNQQPTHSSPSSEDRDTTDQKQKERLRDLDVNKRDGSVIKGGVPKQPDCAKEF